MIETTIIDQAIKIIGSLGFPIFMAIALFWMVNKTMKELTEAILELKDAIYKTTFHPTDPNAKP